MLSSNFSFNLTNNSSISLNKPLLKSEPKKHLIDPVKIIMPSELFNYVGEFRILSCKSVKNNILQREKITLQGVDYWELDREKWEDDGSLWGTRNGTYLVGVPQRFNKHNVVVNNNIKTQAKGQYESVSYTHLTLPTKA